ncbi:Uma2 family endonuclease [Pseudanabaena sp. FACHB-1998]|uniref:Uma2 family endonuclease n=1 Tax=Pseudanabaena sp. FACHB-1998 TaxID=2692858 RepID=UPI0016813788|nr:Uma2 family endonuclease [Pseudanabaena sp. FACHB-1998]MBD2178853.1 Uma2 family endonuclease [Pseudanabaena sp. FACHB-1998]
MIAIAKSPLSSAPTKHRFTVEQYYKMAEVGILGIEERTELIEGEITEMSPIGAKHAGSINRLNRRFSAIVNNQAIIAVQNSISLNDYSEPQPDLAILHWREDFYTQSLPNPSEIFLLIEVADSTIKYDREVKAPLYAKAGIPELWIVNLEAQVFEVYRQPSETGYQQMQIYTKGQTVQLEQLPNVEIEIDFVF